MFSLKFVKFFNKWSYARPLRGVNLRQKTERLELNESFSGKIFENERYDQENFFKLS